MSFQDDSAGPDKYTGVTYQGKEVILTSTRGTPPQGLVRLGMEKGIFTQEKQIELATIFAVTGDVAVTAEMCKVNPQHLRKLIKTDDFRSILKEIREENSEKFDAKFSLIVEKAQDQLLDRLENGDVKLTRAGQVRIPMNGKDVAVVAAVNFDKLQLIRGKPTSRTESSSNHSRLEALAEKFIALAQKVNKPRPVEILDVEVIKNEDGQLGN